MSRNKKAGKRPRARRISLELERLEQRVLLSAPVIQSLSDQPDPVHEGDTLTLNAYNVTDPDGDDIAQVSFYRSDDAAFDLGQDTLLGVDTNGADANGWQWQGPADWEPGVWYYFARALDSTGEWSAPQMIAGTVNDLPAIASLTGEPEPTGPGEMLTLTAGGVSDSDGAVIFVDFYHDSNFNGVWDPGFDLPLGRDSDGLDNWTWTGEVDWTTGDYFAVATDNHFGQSDPVVGHVDQKPVIEFLQNNPNPVQEGQYVTFIASGVSDSDGTVTAVRFYRDVYDSGHYNPQHDELLGYGLPMGGGDWYLTVVADWDPDVSPMYFAIAEDNETDDEGNPFESDPVWTVNQNPEVDHLSGSPDPVALGEDLTLYAYGVADSDGFVETVVFSTEDYSDWWPEGGMPTEDHWDQDGADDWTWTLTPDWTITAMEMADFDQDGDMDVAVVVDVTPNIGNDFVSVLLNDGNGVFRSDSLVELHFYIYLWDCQLEPTDLVVADFNGDTYPDIAVADSGVDQISVLMNTGDPDEDGEEYFDSYANFEVDFSPVWVVMPESIAAADFTGEGNVDIAVASPDADEISVLFGDGEGNFTLHRVYSFSDYWSPPPPAVDPQDMVAADFDQDGLYDIATVSHGGLLVLWNSGGGDFSDAGNVLGKAMETGITGFEDQEIGYNFIYRTGLTYVSYNWRTDDYYHSWLSGTDVDMYRISVGEGAQVTVGFDAIPPPDPEDKPVTPFLYICDYTGSTVASAEGEEGQLLLELEWTSPAAGNYYIACAGWDLADAGYNFVTGLWDEAGSTTLGEYNLYVDVVADYGSSYTAAEDLLVFDAEHWPPQSGYPGILGNVYFFDDDDDWLWTEGEDLWADQSAGVEGHYEGVVDTQIYDGGDGWDTPDGRPGIQDAVIFADTIVVNGLWDVDEDVWADDGNGVYDDIGDTPLYEGADGWTTEGLDPGIPGNIYLSDRDHSGDYSAGDEVWADEFVLLNGLYDVGVDIRIFDVDAWDVADGADGFQFDVLFHDANGNGLWDEEEYLWAERLWTGTYDQLWDVRIFDTETWDPLNGDIGIHGNLYFFDANENELWDPGENVWADNNGNGVFDGGIDTPVFDTALWPPVNGDVGIQGDLLFNDDIIINGVWDDGEDIWQEMNPLPTVGIQDGVLFQNADFNGQWNSGEEVWVDENLNGLYDEEIQVYEGPDGWTTAEGTPGFLNIVIFADTDGDGAFDRTEEVWADLNADTFYDVGETQIYDGGDGFWDTLDGAPGISGNLYLNDADSDGEFDEGEDVWADASVLPNGEYDDIEETHIYDGGDGIWQTEDAEAGVNGNVYYDDADADVAWGPHELVWVDRNGDVWYDEGTETVLYEPHYYDDGLDVQVYDGGDGWQTPDGTPGIVGDLRFKDVNESDSWDPGEYVWADTFQNGLYDEGGDTRICDVDAWDAWQPLSGDAGIRGNVYFYDRPEFFDPEDQEWVGNGIWDPGENVWADQMRIPPVPLPLGAGDSIVAADFLEDDYNHTLDPLDIDIAIANSVTNQVTVLHGNLTSAGWYIGLYPREDRSAAQWGLPGTYDLGMDWDVLISAPPPGGAEGIYGDLWFNDANGNLLWDLDEDIWADLAADGVYDEGTDVRVVNEADWDVTDGAVGLQSNVYFYDVNLNGVWDSGESIWADLAGVTYIVGEGPNSIIAPNVDGDLFRDSWGEPDFDWAQGSVEYLPPHDPYMDLITTNNDGSLSVLINEGEHSGNFSFEFSYVGTFGDPSENYHVKDYRLNGPFDQPCAVMVDDFNEDGVQTFVVAEKYGLAVLQHAYPFHNSDPLDLDQYDSEVPHVRQPFGYQGRYSVIPVEDLHLVANYFAIAFDEDYSGWFWNDPGPNPQYEGYSRSVTVDIPLNQAPQIWELVDNREHLVDADELTLSAVGVTDVDGVVALLEFYRDDGDWLFDPTVDELLGVDENGSDGWSWVGPALDTGGMFFARAQDNYGDYGKPVDILINHVPTIQILYVNGRYESDRDTLVIGDEPADGRIGIRGRLQFLDLNFNDRWDEGEEIWQEDMPQNGIYDEEIQVYDGPDGWTTAPGTAGDQGIVIFRDADRDGAFDRNEEAWVDTNDNNEYDPGETQLYDGGDGDWDTAEGQEGTAGNLYLNDANVNGEFDEGEDVWADASISMNGEYNSIQEERIYDGGDGWQTTDAADGMIGNLLFYDANGNGERGGVEGVWAEQVVEQSPLLITAVDVAVGQNSGGGEIRKVHFYRDSNYNGVFDPLLDYFMGRGENSGDLADMGTDEGDEWTFEVDAVDWSPGSQKYFAVAQDFLDRWSAEAGGRNEVVNIRPLLDSLEDDPDPVTEGEALTLTAIGVDDPYGQVHSVTFYLDDGDGDFVLEQERLIGIDESGGDGWSWTGLVDWPAGDYFYWARVTDNYGAWSDPARADGVVNARPVYGGTFLDAELYSSSGTPSWVAAADLDGNGSSDLVVGNSDIDSVTVLSGVGDGTFAYWDDYDVGAWQSFVLLVDLDNDRALDLVTANVDGITILLGTVDGTFDDANPHTWPLGVLPTAIAAGDFDEDLKLDLAVTNGSGVSILFGRGDGTIEESTPINLGGAASSVVVGDFDGDLNLDLAVTRVEAGVGSVSVLLGKGKRVDGFDPPLEFPVGDNPSSIVAADLDGDGILDLAVAEADDDNVSVWLGNGDGFFRASGANNPVQDNPVAVITGYFDEDSRLDLATVSLDQDRLSLLLSNGAGLFAEEAFYGVGTAPVALATADFNTDDTFDIAVAHGGGVDVLLGIGGLTDDPDPVDQLDNFVLLANGLRDPDGDDIVLVEFYRDSNGSGALEVAIDAQLDQESVEYVTGGPEGYGTWKWEGPADWPVGDQIYFTVALDERGAWSRPSAEPGRVENPPPVIGELVADVDPVTEGDNLTLVALNVTDANGTIAMVEFYRDADDNDSFDPALDDLLGVATSAEANNYVWTGTVRWEHGPHSYFARAIDDLGAYDVAMFEGYVNGRPWIDDLSADPNPITPGDILTLTATGVGDDEGGVVQVEFYRDTNGDGRFQDDRDEAIGFDDDEYGGWSIQFAAATDTHIFFARALDPMGGWSYAASVEVNRLPVVSSLEGFPDPIARFSTLRLEAIDVYDVDGYVDAVEFWRDDGDGTFHVGDGLYADEDVMVAGPTPPADTPGTVGALFNDLNSNGRWDEGEEIWWDDISANGIYDEEICVYEGPDGWTTAEGTAGVQGIAVFRDADEDGAFDRNEEAWVDANGDGLYDDGETQLYDGGDGQWDTVAGQEGIAGNLFLNDANVNDEFDEGEDVWADASISMNGEYDFIREERIYTGGDGWQTTDAAGGIVGNLFFYDVNENGKRDANEGLWADHADHRLGIDTTAGDGWTWTGVVTWEGGPHTYFARARDDFGDWNLNEDAPLTHGYVNQLPVVVSLDLDPDPVTRGEDLTLIAEGVGDPDGTVQEVEFYRDENDNGVLDVGVDEFLGRDMDGSAPDGWSVTVSTEGWNLGEHTYFVRVRDNNDAWSDTVSATGEVNGRPFIGVLNVEPRPVTLGDDLRLTAYGVGDSDVDGYVVEVRFYMDTNANGTWDPTDDLLGTGTEQDGDWWLEVSTDGWSVGVNTYFARAQDDDGAWSEPPQLTTGGVNGPPVIGDLSDEPDPVTRGNDLTLTAENVDDPDGTVVEVEFYRDADDDGDLDPLVDVLLGNDEDGADGWEWLGTTDGFPSGELTYFARARDNDGGWSAAAETTGTVENRPPSIGSIDAQPHSIPRGENHFLTITAYGVVDPDGQVVLLEVYRDSNGSDLLELGVDDLLGTDDDGLDGWSVTTATAGFDDGDNRYFARVQDNDGDWSDPPATTTSDVQNLPPIIGGFEDDPDPVIPGDLLTLTALDILDTDGHVVEVRFYEDYNGNGAYDDGVDTLLAVDDIEADGWSAELDTTAWLFGHHTYFARALDNDGAWSDAAVTTGEVAYALIDSRVVNGAVISFYDVDISNGTSNPEIAWGRSDYVRGADILVDDRWVGPGQVAGIYLYGDGAQTRDLGIVVAGDRGLVRFMDLRLPLQDSPVAFLAVEGDVGIAAFNHGLSGTPVNSFIEPGGWTLPADIDGNDDGWDATGFYAAGNVAQLRITGDVPADLVADGLLSYLGVQSALHGEVTARDGIGSIIVRGDIAGDINSTGDIALIYALGGDISADITAHPDPWATDIGRVLACAVNGSGGAIAGGSIQADGDIGLIYSLGGAGLTSDVSVGGDLARLYVTSGDLAGTLDVGGNVGSIIVINGDMGADTTVGGGLVLLKTVNGDVTGDVDVAGHLRVAAAVGTGGQGGISGDISAGGGLRQLFASADLTGSVSVTGELGSVTVRGTMDGAGIDVTAGGLSALWAGNVTGSLITVERYFRSALVAGDFFDSTIDAGQLRRVAVRGEIGGDGDDIIHATTGSFLVADADDVLWVNPGDLYDLDGVWVSSG